MHRPVLWLTNYNMDAAWYYADPSNAAGKIKDHIAFWKGVEVVT